MTPGLPSLLTVEEVMHRYRLRDPRAARNLIRRAGGFKVAGRWMIRISTIDEHEKANTQSANGSSQGPRSTLFTPVHRVRPLAPLDPGWHTEGTTDD